ncbi:MAG: chromosomal replication initiator protein DnaA [Thermodesulfobacteriota bacterium]
MEAIWQAAKNILKERIPSHSFNMWIEPMEFEKDKPDGLMLACPNLFFKKRVMDQYGALIEQELSRISGKPCQLFLAVSDKNRKSKSKPDEERQLPLPNLNLQPHSGRLLRKDFTFDQFVVGDNNDFAYSAALSMASHKNSHQNSLFLLSKTGMGKSHLSQAVGHFILSEYPSERVYYITSEDFTNEMIHALRHDALDRFKEKYRKRCDVLLLEDIHFLSGKVGTQTELALTLDCLLDANKKLIFTSCYLPADIPKMNEQLSSRLSCSLISAIDPPDFRTRVRILEKKAKLNGYEMPDDVKSYLAGELSENVRQLESGLIGVTAKSSLLGSPIDLNLAKSVVKNIVRQSKNITLDVIKKLVCREFNITLADIISRSRKQTIVRPRQIAMFLSRRYTDSPLQEIGRSFNRYHATALHAIGAIERQLRQSVAMRRQVEFLSNKLEAGKF